MFITFEGPDGAGKSTIIKMVAEHLQQKREILLTREPGGIDIAEKIREVILNPEHTAMDERTEALLYAAARSQHLAEKVEPALALGKIVLCDRFIDSSLAYQGHARGLGIEEVLSINEFAIRGRFPDLTIFFNVSPEVGLQRIHQNRTDEINRLDNEKLSFHQLVHEGYAIVNERYQSRIKVIDAEQSIEKVFADVMAIIDNAISSERV